MTKMFNTKTDKIYMNCSTMICADESGGYKIYTSEDNISWTLQDSFGYPKITKVNDAITCKEYSNGDVIVFARSPVDNGFHILAKYEALK